MVHDHLIHHYLSQHGGYQTNQLQCQAGEKNIPHESLLLQKCVHEVTQAALLLCR